MKTKVVLLLFILLICASCNKQASRPTPTPEPRSEWLVKWLSSPTCQAPCWENIIPGKTSWQEAQNILINLPVLKVEIIPSSQRGYGLNWTFFELGLSSGSAHADKDGIIQTISLGFDENQTPVTLEEIKLIFGPPAGIYLNDCRKETLGYNNCEIYITFPEKGMVFVFFLDNKGKENFQVDISPSIRSSSVTLFQTSTDESQMNALSYLDPKKFYPWKGYGLYP